ncbi:ABC transporter permease [Paraburkholderia sp. MPAMCS5]|uniref:ABC transporter permease n=1 Tax=Paraburkholderia sp. MPAMCS5 TaxID=3112563 RepID=UPI002E19611D|nr:ABC transporter permease [Paraburkholderia sp. MPAMCS5]
MLSPIMKALWGYRGFILGNVKREFQSKYRNSLLGAAWTVLNPLAMIIVYTVIFSQLMRARLPGTTSSFAYSIYLCAGSLTWGLFAEVVGRGQNVFLDNANLLKKISFPRLCLPATIVCNSLLNFGIIFGLFTVFLIGSGNFPGVVFIALVPVIFVLILFAIGLGITIGVLNVFFRDVGQFFAIFLQFWFWLTPIVYPVDVLPPRVHPLIKYNPMTGIVTSCQAILVKGQWPDWPSLLPAAILAVFFLAFGMRLFRRHSGEMVDEL